MCFKHSDDIKMFVLLSAIFFGTTSLWSTIWVETETCKNPPLSSTLELLFTIRQQPTHDSLNSSVLWVSLCFLLPGIRTISLSRLSKTKISKQNLEDSKSQRSKHFGILVFSDRWKSQFIKRELSVILYNIFF